ncbi:hypothetical protein NT01EI_2499 [Edwardsiella ictaluri 93-146]|uniref:Uncharacterized protein n=1 Tax=Edwardsiella ictaluri (strain 93-146) TaxID=634503 RepID=C5BEA8_EDWI9|nr:hypothetical protein NT01EI_2499 [Edwardsiella ictaluri 93-146]
MENPLLKLYLLCLFKGNPGIAFEKGVFNATFTLFDVTQFLLRMGFIF